MTPHSRMGTGRGRVPASSDAGGAVATTHALHRSPSLNAAITVLPCSPAAGHTHATAGYARPATRARAREHRRRPLFEGSDRARWCAIFYRGFPAHRRPATRTPRPGTHISPPVRAPGSSKADRRNAPPPVALAPPSGLGSRHEYRGCCAEHGKVHVRWLACACWPCMSGVCDCKHSSRSEPASTYDTTSWAVASRRG
jgi:hypothetical protein